LWSEGARIIGELRPHIVFVENVAALLERGMGRVLGDLAARGYDAEWDCLPATAFGAYHERDRVFILANAAELDGRPHDLLEAGEEWRASLQSRRLSGMAVAARAERENTRLRCEPGLARLVRRVPGAMDRLEGIGDAVYPAIAEWIGRRIVEAGTKESERAVSLD
jgi:DNA (cytosine-5)-methyltransferase 1